MLLLQEAMIVCPQCNYQNPDGAKVCESCYTELPALTTCPHCGATVQQDATFCGQCGSPLNPVVSIPKAQEEEEIEIPALVPPDPLVIPELTEMESLTAEALAPSQINPPPAPKALTASLVHELTGQKTVLPTQGFRWHIGKPNDRTPPDIDVSKLPDADVVSRVHAVLSWEEGTYYLEDLGSSNGTYVNDLALVPGNRYPLTNGDRIALGKNNLVTFQFQLS